ncbi:MAG: UvrD-helicase domain-containing protein [Actinomycetaceae bacterium]|nr:UvrD-helicase domain-containing protein [Actinomycetaceae bacterium]
MTHFDSVAQMIQAINAYSHEKNHLPTDEQQRVIAADLEPMLVVAGAGSGKTETMAQRVVWHVVQGNVEPHEVLGLTFTTKAAAELEQRINERIDSAHKSLRRAQQDGGMKVAKDYRESFVQVSTYNGFGAQLVQDFGIRIGVAPQSQLMTQATAYGMMYSIVEAAHEFLPEGEELRAIPSVPTVVKQSLSLAHDLSDHGITLEELDAYATTMITELRERPSATGKSKQPKEYTKKTLDSMVKRRAYIPFIREFWRQKRERSLLEFSDQIAYASRIACHYRDVGKLLRTRYKLVLLDEFQDTSSSQIAMLSHLFKGHAVTAVGDPHQAIYGWRGASQGSLVQFRKEFATTQPVKEYSLSTAWRNDYRILDIANRIAAPLWESYDELSLKMGVTSEQPIKGGAHDVCQSNGITAGNDAGKVLLGSLQQTSATQQGGVVQEKNVAANSSVHFGPKSQSGEEPRSLRFRSTERSLKDAGHVQVLYTRSEPEYLEAIAQWCLHRWDRNETCAVLARRNSELNALQEVFSRYPSLPFRREGLAGLLYEPAVADIRAALEVLADASQGPALLRLLTRQALGVADLKALYDHAFTIARRDMKVSQSEDTSSTQNLRPEVIVMDAIDTPPLPEESGLSELGYDRVIRLRDSLRYLRSCTSLELPELIEQITLRLDIDIDEVAANDDGSGLLAIEKFTKVAEEFLTLHPGGGLPAFLLWLDHAQQLERGLANVDVVANENVIQLMTVHGAKGLEWDNVIVIGMEEGVFPKVGTRKGGSQYSENAWLTDAGILPYELRQDSIALPHLEFVPDDYTFVSVEESLDNLRCDMGKHLVDEERRLAYVAFTRAKHRLIVAGAYFHHKVVRPKQPSSFLTEICQAFPRDMLEPLDGHSQMFVELEEDATNPLSEEEVSVAWPPSVATLKEQRLAEGAERVLSEIARSDDMTEVLEKAGSEFIARTGPLDPLVEAALLLRERDEQDAGSDLFIPLTLSVTTAVDMVGNKQKALEYYHRPMPRQPSKGAQVGTLLHEWIDNELTHPHSHHCVNEWPKSLRSSLQKLTKCFQKMNIAQRFELVKSEYPITIVIGGHKLNGRIDAVMRDKHSGRLALIDWKTDSDLHERINDYRAQLCLYRFALCEQLSLKESEIDLYLAHIPSSQLIQIEGIGADGSDENKLDYDGWKKLLFPYDDVSGR